MLNLDLSNRTLIIYLQDHLRSINGKTGLAVLRYSPHPIAAVIDTEYAGRSLVEVTGIARQVPIVASLEDAIAQGGDTVLIGLSPSGGRLIGHHREVVMNAISAGLSVINGLHDRLNHLNPHITGTQEIFDIRVPPPECFVVGFGRAQSLPNQRVLTVGTDMAIGKMSACLEFHAAAKNRGISSQFFATGQTGIVIAGQGIPLDAVPVDFAAGAVEYGVMTLSAENPDIVWIEGQGSMLNPASTATLPLIRGSQPTGLVLVHRAGQTAVKNNPAFPIPPLKEVVAFYESVVKAAGTFPAAPVQAIALNTADLPHDDALSYIHLIEKETGRPTDDVVRFGAERLLSAIIGSR